MSDNKTNWMDEDEARTDEQAGTIPNPKAPQLVRKEIKVPPRIRKGLYIQDIHSMAFDRVVFAQKQVKGKTAPELAEEAIELLLKKYKLKLEE